MTIGAGRRGLGVTGLNCLAARSPDHLRLVVLAEGQIGRRVRICRHRRRGDHGGRVVPAELVGSKPIECRLTAAEGQARIEVVAVIDCPARPGEPDTVARIQRRRIAGRPGAWRQQVIGGGRPEQRAIASPARIETVAVSGAGLDRNDHRVGRRDHGRAVMGAGGIGRRRKVYRRRPAYCAERLRGRRGDSGVLCVAAERAPARGRAAPRRPPPIGTRRGRTLPIQTGGAQRIGNSTARSRVFSGGARRSTALAGAGEGNRTLVVSLGSFCSAIELHPRGA